jgi:hypothetical protein
MILENTPSNRRVSGNNETKQTLFEPKLFVGEIEEKKYLHPPAGRGIGYSAVDCPLLSLLHAGPHDGSRLDRSQLEAAGAKRLFAFLFRAPLQCTADRCPRFVHRQLSLPLLPSPILPSISMASARRQERDALHFLVL